MEKTKTEALDWVPLALDKHTGMMCEAESTGFTKHPPNCLLLLLSWGQTA